MLISLPSFHFNHSTEVLQVQPTTHSASAPILLLGRLPLKEVTETRRLEHTLVEGRKRYFLLYIEWILMEAVYKLFSVIRLSGNSFSFFHFFRNRRDTYITNSRNHKRRKAIQ
jgi:hypothetical protein